MDWKLLATKAYAKLEMLFLKSFRGLLCEKKENGWELSKGNVAFWLVLAHCMSVWSKTVEAVAPMAEEAAGMLDSAYAMAGNGVPEQEFYLLMSLLGYSAVKATKGGMTGALMAARGGK